jgi:hypothetical protein
MISYFATGGRVRAQTTLCFFRRRSTLAACIAVVQAKPTGFDSRSMMYASAVLSISIGHVSGEL